MKRVYVDEKWCLGCHLCEYYCAFANSGGTDMVKALKGRKLQPRMRIEEKGGISFAVSCRHCVEPLCVKSCISGALSSADGVVVIDRKQVRGLLYLRAGVPLWGVDPQRRRRDAQMRAVYRKRLRPPGLRGRAAPTKRLCLRSVEHEIRDHRQFRGGRRRRGGHPLPGQDGRDHPRQRRERTSPIPGR